jgi:hypothetical protein
MPTLTREEYTSLRDRFDGVRADYSGRGMYGDACLAYTGDEPYLFVFDLAELLAERDSDDPSPSDIRYELSSLSASGDSMGRGSVIYFTGIDVEPGDDDDDEDDD